MNRRQNRSIPRFTAPGVFWVDCRLRTRLTVRPALPSAGLVTPEMMDGWVKAVGVELRGAGLDESPDCYKRLPEVLASTPIPFGFYTHSSLSAWRWPGPMSSILLRI